MSLSTLAYSEPIFTCSAANRRTLCAPKVASPRPRLTDDTSLLRLYSIGYIEGNVKSTPHLTMCPPYHPTNLKSAKMRHNRSEPADKVVHESFLSHIEYGTDACRPRAPRIAVNPACLPQAAPPARTSPPALAADWPCRGEELDDSLATDLLRVPKKRLDAALHRRRNLAQDHQSLRDAEAKYFIPERRALEIDRGGAE